MTPVEFGIGSLYGAVCTLAFLLGLCGKATRADAVVLLGATLVFVASRFLP